MIYFLTILVGLALSWESALVVFVGFFGLDLLFTFIIPEVQAHRRLRRSRKAARKRLQVRRDRLKKT